MDLQLVVLCPLGLLAPVSQTDAGQVVLEHRARYVRLHAQLLVKQAHVHELPDR